MLKALSINGVTQPNLILPDEFKKVASDTRTRNDEPVLVERYQRDENAQPNHEHVTLVWGQDHRLISFNKFSLADDSGKLPSKRQAAKIALATMMALDARYASELSYMRTDLLTRSYLDDNEQLVTIPIQWVKFAHPNGSYNWVSVGAGGQVIEMERESYWDYFLSRRSTEEWNYDNWVLAYEGKGPQPAAPEALA